VKMSNKGMGIRGSGKEKAVMLLKRYGFITHEMLVKEGVNKLAAYKIIKALLRAKLIVKVTRGIYEKTELFDKLVLEGKEDEIYRLTKE